MARLAAAVLLFGCALPAAAAAQSDLAAERGRMLEDIRQLAEEVGSVTGRPKLDERVLGAIGQVPRHAFVPAEQQPAAYRNRALAIGHGQTISQPFIVALMTDLLEPKPSDRVLEVGTGSGYQAAVLSHLVREVYTIEIVEELGKAAAEALQRLGYTNVTARIGDGYAGWEAHAPYDAIIVTAAPDDVPQALIDQLKPGGRMVIPVGATDQELMVVTRATDGGTTSTRVVPVRFVPLTRTRPAE